MTNPNAFAAHVAVEATVDGRTTTSTFASEERAACFEQRVANCGGTSRRVAVPTRHPMIERFCP